MLPAPTPRGTRYDRQAAMEALGVTGPSTADAGALIDQAASAYLAAERDYNLAPSVAALRSRLAALSRAIGEAEELLDDPHVRDVLGLQQPEHSAAELGRIGGAAAAAVLPAAGSSYLHRRLHPKGELAAAALGLWLQHRPDPPTSTPGGAFHTFVLALFGYAAGRDPEGPGAGLDHYAKLAVRLWKSEPRIGAAGFLDSARSRSTVDPPTVEGRRDGGAGASDQEILEAQG